MFSFEAVPHDDGMNVREAVESLRGEIVKMSVPTRFKFRGEDSERVEIVDTYPAFFTIRRIDHIRDSYVECVAYRDYTAGLFSSKAIDAEIHRIEAQSPDKRQKRVKSII